LFETFGAYVPAVSINISGDERPELLVGGGTGMIGDPSGRSAERNLLDAETLAANVAKEQGTLLAAQTS